MTGRTTPEAEWLGLSPSLPNELPACPEICVASSVALDNPAFLPIGVGCGLPTGIAVGSSLQRRQEGEEQEGDEPMVGDEGVGEDGAS